MFGVVKALVDGIGFLDVAEGVYAPYYVKIYPKYGTFKNIT